MATLKCKKCGGDLNIIPDTTVCECEYCGRTFLPDRLPVHQKICAKHPEMFKKKK